MTSQGVPSRKRPAPGTSPVVQQQMGSMPTYTSNPNTGLSNDQFLQWGSEPSNTVNPFPVDVNSYNAVQYANQDMPATGVSSSNQLTRRPINQLISRNRGYEQPPPPPSMAEHNPGDGWGESLAELEQRAIIAKRDSQAKRKQIPPFVQKLSRYAMCDGLVPLISCTDDVAVSSTSLRIPSSSAGLMMGTHSLSWMKMSLLEN
jgi:heat shock transcription factor